MIVENHRAPHYAFGHLANQVKLRLAMAPTCPSIAS